MTTESKVDWLLATEYVQKELEKLKEQRRLKEFEKNKDDTCYWLLGQQVAQKEAADREAERSINNPVTKKKLEILDKIEKSLEESEEDGENDE